MIVKINGAKMREARKLVLIRQDQIALDTVWPTMGRTSSLSCRVRLVPLRGPFFIQSFLVVAQAIPAKEDNLSIWERQTTASDTPARPNGIHRDSGISTGQWHEVDNPTTGHNRWGRQAGTCKNAP